jgi:hypothetical protein
MNGLKIFGENFVNKDCEFSITYGAELAENLYDQKRDSQWVGLGAPETMTATIICYFKNWQGQYCSRTFDRVLLLNHNIASYQMYYWNPELPGWSIIPEGSITPFVDPYNSAANTLVEIATPITSTAFRIKANTAIDGLSDKAIGELKVCQSIFTGSQLWSTQFQEGGESRSGSFYTKSGELVSWCDYSKAKGSLSISNVSASDLATFRPYLKPATPLTLVLADDFDLSNAWEMFVEGNPSVLLDRKSQVYDVGLELKEK